MAENMDLVTLNQLLEQVLRRFPQVALNPPATDQDFAGLCQLFKVPSLPPSFILLYSLHNGQSVNFPAIFAHPEINPDPVGLFLNNYQWLPISSLIEHYTDMTSQRQGSLILPWCSFPSIHPTEWNKSNWIPFANDSNLGNYYMMDVHTGDIVDYDNDAFSRTPIPTDLVTFLIQSLEKLLR